MKATLDDQIAALEDRIINARSVEIGAKLHDELDELRERRETQPDDYQRGYQAGYHAGFRHGKAGRASIEPVR